MKKLAQTLNVACLVLAPLVCLTQLYVHNWQLAAAWALITGFNVIIIRLRAEAATKG